MSEQDNNQTITDDQTTNSIPDQDELTSQLEFEDDSSEATETAGGDDTSEETSESEESNDSQTSEDKEQSENSELPPQETEAERNRKAYEMRQEEKRQRQQIERQMDNVYQPQPVDELTQAYIDQGYDERQAQMYARDDVRAQREQIAEARAQVAELNMQINSEAMQVLHEFPEFDPNSPKYDKEFAEMATQKWRRESGSQTDPRTGFVVQTNLMPYDFYKDLHDIHTMGNSRAQMTAQRNLEQQMNSVAPSTSTVVTKAKSKEDKEADELAEALRNVR